MARVLVTGGRGDLGSRVVQRLREHGHEAVAAGRRGPIVLDVRRDEGLDAALEGAEAVVHCATHPAGRDAREVEVEGTARVVRAAARAGVAHLVYVSIVGVDRVPYAYYRHKLHAEKVIDRGEVPWSILRATQFFGFVARLLTTPPVLVAPRGFLLQPVAAEEVADRLVRAVEDGPCGRLRDLGGPEIVEVGELAAALRRTRRLRRPLLRPWLPGRLAAAVRAGGLTCPGGDRGAQIWQSWLSERWGGAG